MSAPTTRELRNRPVVAVHTGDGKGKTTAAVGMALRAWAQGWDVGVYQFVKSAKWHSGEQDAFAELPERGGLTWEKMGSGWSWSRAHDPADAAGLARDGWRRVREGLAEQRHRFWLLDEFTYPLTWGWIDVSEVVGALAARPGNQHVVITGRGCPEALVDAADLVTHMTLVKHPFQQGRRGQAGIEW